MCTSAWLNRPMLIRISASRSVLFMAGSINNTRYRIHRIQRRIMDIDTRNNHSRSLSASTERNGLTLLSNPSVTPSSVSMRQPVRNLADLLILNHVKLREEAAVMKKWKRFPELNDILLGFRKRYKSTSDILH